jgi:hypothetical protein
VSVIEKIQTARTTDRRCEDCREPLPRGQRYRLHIAPPGDIELANDSWWTLAECWDCANKRGAPIDPELYPPKLAVDDWNAKHPVGTRVRYWNFPGDDPREAKTQTEASLTPPNGRLMGGAVIWLEGVSGWWALSHVEAIEESA